MSRSALDTPRPLLPGVSPVRGQALRWSLPVALLMSVAPFVATGIRATAQLGAGFRDAGDQAVFGIAVHDASTLHQLLGPYSRFGWSHPGPSWFYLLAPLYRALGGSDAALVGANAILNGLFAAAVVAAVHRAGRPVLTLVTAGLLLAFVLRMPAVFFVQIWNPFVLGLAVVLFLVLAARAHDGRWTSLFLFLIAGSFLVQTHVGTAPLVGLVGVAGVVAFVVGRRAARRRAAGRSADRLDAAPHGEGGAGVRGDGAPAGRSAARRQWYAPAGLALVLAAMWALPVYQQLTSPLRQGNLGRLVHFFLFQGEQGAHPTVRQSVIAVGRLLAMAPYGWGPGPYEMDLTRLPFAVGLGLAAQALVSLGLVIAGRRWGSTSAAWTGVVTLLALVAAIAAMTSVTGTVYWYLELWVSAIPLATAIGIAQLVWDRPAGAAGTRWPSDGRWARIPVPALVISGLLLAGSAAVGVSLTRAVAQVPASAGVRAVTSLLDHSLPGRRTTPVKVNIVTHDFWPLGSGVVQDLVQHGSDVHVGAANADLFGTARATNAHEPVEITLIDPADKAVPDLVRDGNAVLGTVDTEFGRAEVLLKTSR